MIERRQVHDLPPLRLEVTEHQTLAARCSASQTVTCGSFPPEVTAPTQYGPGVRALAVYLNQYQLVPTARTQEALPDVVDCGVSEGTLVGWVAKAATTLAPSVARIADLVAANLHLHADETGMHIDGKLHWLHVASTRWLTHLTWHANRGRAAAEAIGIWPRFRGRATHDRWASYGAYTACRHSLCGAHLVRELTFLEETYAQTWAGACVTSYCACARQRTTGAFGERAACPMANAPTGWRSTMSCSPKVSLPSRRQGEPQTEARAGAAGADCCWWGIVRSPPPAWGTPVASAVSDWSHVCCSMPSSTILSHLSPKTNPASSPSRDRASPRSVTA